MHLFVISANTYVFVKKKMHVEGDKFLLTRNSSLTSGNHGYFDEKERMKSLSVFSKCEANKPRCGSAGPQNNQKTHISILIPLITSFLSFMRGDVGSPRQSHNQDNRSLDTEALPTHI